MRKQLLPVILLIALFVLPLSAVAIIFRDQLIGAQCSPVEPIVVEKQTTELGCVITQRQSEMNDEITERKVSVTVQNEIITTPALPYIEPNEVEVLINQERVRHGLDELQPNECLRQAAMIRAKEASQLFSHTRPDDSEYSSATFPCSRLTPTKKTILGVGENLATNFMQPELVIPAWLNSPTHRDVMLDGRFKYIGVGVFENYIAMEVSN